MGATSITGVSHVAINTPDLDRFVRFYDSVLGLRVLVPPMSMPHEPFFRMAVLDLGGRGVLHVVEIPGYDPAADGLTGEIGRRGPVDHFGLGVASRADLDEMAARLRAAGASDGEIRAQGRSCSVFFRDPDGLAAEVDWVDPDRLPPTTGRDRA